MSTPRTEGTASRRAGTVEGYPAVPGSALLARTFAAADRLRRARVFHPNGVLLDGEWEAYPDGPLAGAGPRAAVTVRLFQGRRAARRDAGHSGLRDAGALRPRGVGPNRRNPVTLTLTAVRGIDTRCPAGRVRLDRVRPDEARPAFEWAARRPGGGVPPVALRSARDGLPGQPGRPGAQRGRPGGWVAVAAQAGGRALAWARSRRGYPARAVWYASGADRARRGAKVVQRRLGHSSPVVTLTTYAHLFPDSDDRTRDAVSAAPSAADPVRTERVR